MVVLKIHAHWQFLILPRLFQVYIDVTAHADVSYLQRKTCLQKVKLAGC